MEYLIHITGGHDKQETIKSHRYAFYSTLNVECSSVYTVWYLYYMLKLFQGKGAKKSRLHSEKNIKV